MTEGRVCLCTFPICFSNVNNVIFSKVAESALKKGEQVQAAFLRVVEKQALCGWPPLCVAAAQPCPCCPCGSRLPGLETTLPPTASYRRPPQGS